MLEDDTGIVRGYNERLFARPGLRRFYHLARFYWLRRQLATYCSGPLRLVEVGCFDGRSLDFVPWPIERYLGLDAGWEGGFHSALADHAGKPGVDFVQTLTPEPLRKLPPDSFDAGIALETLEHMPVDTMRGYLAELARVIDGPLLISVPNELGIVFLAKFLAKRFGYGDADDYTWREFVAAVVRQPARIERKEHKGFDYRALLVDLDRHYEVREVEGLPPLGLPPALSLTVGIVAWPRGKAKAA